MKPHRIRMTHNLLLNYGLYRKMEIYVRTHILSGSVVCELLYYNGSLHVNSVVHIHVHVCLYMSSKHPGFILCLKSHTYTCTIRVCTCARTCMCMCMYICIVIGSVHKPTYSVCAPCTLKDSHASMVQHFQ